MKPIFVRGISHQFRLTLAIILSVALFVANDRLEPVRQSLSSLLSPLQYLANVPGLMLDWTAEALATRNMLAVQNKTLMDQQLLMSERLQRFEHLRQENVRLRALLGSPVHMESRKVVAEVMEVASDPFRQLVVLNHGQRTGVFVGQPVVDAKGVVGQVIEVSELTSRVLLVSDASHGIPVRVTRNDVRAIANGTGEIDQVELRHVAKSTDVIAGDLLVTSGLGNRFPEGYPVARVTSVSRDDGQSYAVINAQPLAALDRIRYVLLIWPGEADDKPFWPILPAVEQTDNNNTVEPKIDSGVAIEPTPDSATEQEPSSEMQPNQVQPNQVQQTQTQSIHVQSTPAQPIQTQSTQTQSTTEVRQ
ncbi:rod shape-determining protein MreC [Shewanella sp. HL-SH8]|uniref:rod shape-determining protein MreC n=1 Tax=Shewanella sp. HL-SH8 TaxID=3436242 RepID=UPI003EBEB765